MPIDTSTPRPWLPTWFRHPTHVELSTGHHLRPVRALDVDLHLPAVLSCRERLWQRYGAVWGWPASGTTREQDRLDLADHERQMTERTSYCYALFDEAEQAVLGCVHLLPPRGEGADADVSWWVLEHLVGGEVEAVVDEEVPRWLSRDWPFRRPRLLGRDVSWQDWAALPARCPQ